MPVTFPEPEEQKSAPDPAPLIVVTNFAAELAPFFGKRIQATHWKSRYPHHYFIPTHVDQENGHVICGTSYNDLDAPPEEDDMWSALGVWELYTGPRHPDDKEP